MTALTTLRAPAYGPPPLLDLGQAALEREQLAAPACKAFLRLMARWRVRAADAHCLLGVSRWSYDAIKRQPQGRLGADSLHRIACLLTIHDALDALHGEAQAARWLRLPNTNGVFAGATPLAYLLAGGMPALEATRRLLDACVMRS